jgi:hypothetical protein
VHQLEEEALVELLETLVVDEGERRPSFQGLGKVAI